MTPAEIFAAWPPPALDPAGPNAAPVSLLAWVLFFGGAAVLLLVIVATAIALWGSPTWKRRVGGERGVLAGGLVLPVVVLSALLVWGLSLTSRLSAETPAGAMRIRVTGEMWWWRVAYLDAGGRETLQSANEVRIPTGAPVVLELESADVIHSFWVPRLSGKLDMIPGRRNILSFQADRPGVYGGLCTEYCGGPHALMGFTVVAMAPADFARWRAAEGAPAPAATDVRFERGRQVFAAAGCAACHAVRGTGAQGLAGPDLSKVGGRATLGAGVLPVNQGTLAGWTADSQTIKPGNRMPSYRQLSGDDLLAVSGYLAALR